MDVVLGNSTDNIINISGTGGITISSIISGSSKKLTKSGSGSGILTLTGANTYDGLTTVSAGTLKLNRAGGTTIPITNNVTVSGGALQISSNQTLNNLTVSGGNITIDNGITLTVNGTLDLSSGTLTVGGGTLVIGGATITRTSGSIDASNASATVIFTNTSALSLPTSTFTGNITNLTLNGTGGVSINDGVTLTVTGTLALTSGKITLGTGNVIATAVSGGSSSSYVVTAGTGKLTINAVSSATLFPVGPTPSAYNPVTIANGGGSNYAVNVSSTAPTGSGITQPGAAIKRQWDITPSGTPSNVSLTFHYNDNEGVLGSFLPTGSMDGIHFNGTKWDYIGSAMGVVNSPYSVTFTYAGSTWSPFSFGNSGILPTELTDLKAKTQNGQNLITWQTATERNSNHFDIQRTTNPQAHWQTIGTVKAAGNSQTVKEYEYVDNAPLSISYYRLRQVDFDSKETLSNTVSVNFQGKQSDLTVFPTYSENRLTVIGNMDLTTNFEVANLLGQIVLRGRFNGSNDIDVQSLVSGVYILNVNNQTAKFFKK